MNEAKDTEHREGESLSDSQNAQHMSLSGLHASLGAFPRVPGTSKYPTNTAKRRMFLPGHFLTFT